MNTDVNTEVTAEVNGDARALSQSLGGFFSSLKLAMFVLLALAVTSIIGTVIPQGNVPEEYLQSISPAKLKLYRSLGFFDMYHSWWFVLLLAALSANLVACSAKRLPQIWRIVTRPATTLGEHLEKSLPNRDVLTAPGEAASLKELLVRVLGSEFAAPRVTELDGAYHLYAEKTPWCRLAVYVVHLSILVVFVGAIVGSLFGFKGYVAIPEGQSVSRLAGRGGKEIDLGFAVRCDKFSASFYDTGAPKEFRSLLTVLENGKPVPGYDHLPIIVNDPLSYKGITFYQSSYGKTGEHTFAVSDADGGHAQQVTVPSQGSAQLPDGSEVHVLEATPDVASYQPGLSGPAARLEMHAPDGGSRQIVVYANHPELNRESTQKNGGPLFSYLGGKEGMYTGLQVTHDPGVWIVWLGCLLMVIGVYVSFFLSHRRVWVRVSDGRVVIGGNASKNPAGFQLVYERLVERVKAELSATEGK